MATKKGKNKTNRLMRVVATMAGVGANVATAKGLNYLHNQAVMQTETPDKINVKKLAVDAGTVAAGAALSFFTDDDISLAVSVGVAGAGANHGVQVVMIDDAVPGTDGTTQGLGKLDPEEAISVYAKGMQGGNEELDLAGGRQELEIE